MVQYHCKSPYITLSLKNTWMGNRTPLVLKLILNFEFYAAVEGQMQPQLPMVVVFFLACRISPAMDFGP